MIKVDNLKCKIRHNEIWVKFSNYEVCIRPIISENWKNEWGLRFINDDSYTDVICHTLEEAFNLIECYPNQSKFDSLMKDLEN